MYIVYPKKLWTLCEKSTQHKVHAFKTCLCIFVVNIGSDIILGVMLDTYKNGQTCFKCVYLVHLKKLWTLCEESTQHKVHVFKAYLCIFVCA